MGVLICTFRGRFRGRSEQGLSVVVGDRVVVSSTGPGAGVIEEILPRTSELIRGTGEGKPILVAANLDHVLCVLAAVDPPPRWALIDRMIVAAERDGLRPALCLNKWDQVEDGSSAAGALESALEIYRQIGYPVFQVSALTCQGLEALVEWLKSKSTVITGHSGVGKSTLINALHPGLGLVTQQVNPVTGKGRHTTASVALYRMPFGADIVDTPGFREFLPVGLAPSELSLYYPDFAPFREACRFTDCSHRVEPHCAVRDAVEAGKLSKMRYHHYLQILSTLEALES